MLVVRRNYKKLTVILGEFGGILKLITTFFFFFYSFYNLWAVKDYLGKTLFSSELRDQILGKGAKGGSKESGKTTKFIKVKNKLDNSKAEQKKHKEKVKVIDKAVKEFVKSRSQVVDLMNKLNSLELIEQVVFDKNDKKLLPLVLIKARQQKLLEKAKKQKQSKKEEKVAQNQPVKQIAKEQKEEEGCEEDMTFKQAYQLLLESKPQSKLKQIIRDYMLDALDGIFEEEEIGNIENVDRSSPLSKFLRKKINIHKDVEISLDSPGSTKLVQSSQREIISSRRLSMMSRSSKFIKGSTGSLVRRGSSRFGGGSPVRIKMRIKSRHSQFKIKTSGSLKGPYSQVEGINEPQSASQPQLK